MFKCRIADLNIEVNEVYKGVRILTKPFQCEFESPDIVINSSQEIIDYEKSISEDKTKPAKSFYEKNVVYRMIAAQMLDFNGAVLHSACFDVDGVGVAFAAHSGTGKTTHMNLWQKYLGDKMVVVNGDKPIVRFFDDEPETPYAYGTPWNGKERLGCNMRTKLQHICFIERSETNFVEPMNKEDAIDHIFNQVYMPKDPVAVLNTMQLIDRLLSCCKLWTIHCNMEEEAAKIAYDTIFRQDGEK